MKKDTDDLLQSEDQRTLYIGHDRPIRISTGHRLLHHDGKCSQPHGHNYEISIQIDGELTEDGWVVDKSKVTSIVNKWDHKFLLEEGDPLIEAFNETTDSNGFEVIKYPPTAEVMSVILEERIAAISDTITNVNVKVRETHELCASSH